MEWADYHSIDSRKGKADTLATDEEGNPPTIIHTPRRDNGVDNEMSTLKYDRDGVNFYLLDRETSPT